MSGSFNPLLGQPGQIPGNFVPALETKAAPDVVEFAHDYVYFTCSMTTANMFTPQGTKLAFTNGHFRTNVLAQIEYLRNEIKGGHPLITEADAATIREIKMQLDPIDTIKAEVRAEMESELRAKLEAELRAEMGLTTPIVAGEQPDLERDKADAAKIAGIDGSADLGVKLQGLMLKNIASTDQLGGNTAS